MANSLYALGRQAFLEGSIAWLTDSIQFDILDAGVYTPNLTTDQFRTTVGATARVTNYGGSVQTAATKTSTNGTADAADISFTSLAAAPTFEYIQGFKNAGTDATNRLIFLIDTATGLPTPAGVSTINVTWDNGANKVFTL